MPRSAEAPFVIHVSRLVIAQFTGTAFPITVLVGYNCAEVRPRVVHQAGLRDPRAPTLQPCKHQDNALRAIVLNPLAIQEVRRVLSPL